MTTSGSQKEHEEALLILLKRIARLGVRLNLKKSMFFRNIQEGNFNVLGFTILKGSLVPNSDRMNAILNMNSPKSKVEVQRLLGYLTYLRSLLPPKIIDLTTILSPLTSVLDKFKWEKCHETAFKTIKEMLSQATSFNCPRHENAVTIVYTDSSEKLMAGICFSYSLNDVMVEIPEKTKEMMIPIFSNHFDFYNIKCRVFPTESSDYIFEEFVKCVLQSTNMYSTATVTEKDIQDFLNVLYTKIGTLRGYFINLVEMDIFLNYLTNNTMNNELFYENFQTLLVVFSVLLGKNIKLVIGIDRVIKKPFYQDVTIYTQDVLIGYCPKDNKFTLFYITQDFEWQDCKLFSNRRGCINSMEKTEILSSFTSAMKKGDLTPNIRLTDQFSKSFAKPDRGQPIYVKESLAILQSLDYFKRYIKESKLTFLLTDSKISTFLFSRNVHDSCKKLSRWSIKLQLEFPDIVLFHVDGANNVADFLSRLGLSRLEFFRRTLTPLRLNKSLREILPAHYDWTTLIKILEENPNIIEFSSGKIDVRLQNKYFVDDENVLELPSEKAPTLNATENVKMIKEPFVNSIRIFTKKTNYLNIYLSRARIVKEQALEVYNFDLTNEVNGVYFKNGKPILPIYLYIFLGLREHLLSNHSGYQGLLNVCREMFTFENLKMMKKVCNQISSNCLACILGKIKADRNPHGSFKVDKSTVAVQIDLIEGTIGRYANILTIIDVYSRYVTAYPLATKTSAAVQNCLLQYLQTNPTLRYIVSDNASIFRSASMQKFYKSLSIINPSSGVYKSRSRGLVERANGLIQNGIVSLIAEKRENWIYALPLAIFLMNHKIFFGQKLSAANLHFRSAATRIDFFRQEQDSIYQSNVPTNLKETEKEIEEMLLKEEEFLVANRVDVQNTRRIKANKSKKLVEIPNGTFVVLKRRYVATGVSPKFLTPYVRDLYKVIKAGDYNVAMNSVLTGLVVIRPRMDVKTIDTLDMGEDGQLEEKAKKILEIITESNILENFAQPVDIRPTKRVTRQGISVEESAELLDLESYVDTDAFDYYENYRVDFEND